MSALVRGRAALAAGQITNGLVRDLCDELDGMIETWRTAAVSRDRWMARAKDSERQYRGVASERDAALATIERVRAIHFNDRGECDHCPDPADAHWSAPWPCATIQALGDQT